MLQKDSLLKSIMEKLMHIVGAAIVERNSKYLMVRETMDFVKGQWNLPAGTIDPNEDIISCAIREGKEETGLDLEPEHIVGIYNYTAKWKNDVPVIVMKFVIKTKVVSGEEKTSDEISELGWFSLKEIEQMKLDGALRSANTIENIRDFEAGNKIPFETVTVSKII